MPAGTAIVTGSSCGIGCANAERMLAAPARAGTSLRMRPLGRFMEPREVAGQVANLRSEDAAAITGQDIAICGGATLRR